MTYYIVGVRCARSRQKRNKSEARARRVTDQDFPLALLIQSSVDFEMKVFGVTVLDGWARKVNLLSFSASASNCFSPQVGLAAITASLIGWLIFVICFGSFNNGDNL